LAAAVAWQPLYAFSIPTYRHSIVHAGKEQDYSQKIVLTFAILETDITQSIVPAL
jgi:hypothetical protein